MRSLIAEPGSFGDTIKIKVLSREPGNPGWTVIPLRCKLLFMGDLDDIQFLPILQDIADDTVVLSSRSRKQESPYNEQP